jgi:hypothetical protein
MRTDVFEFRTAAVRVYSIGILIPAAIERGCSIGANHAQNRRLTSSDPTTRLANRAIQDNSSTFQQALYASFS